MPNNNKIELSLYVDVAVKEHIERTATEQRRSKSFIGNDLLKSAISGGIDQAVKINLEARAMDLNMTTGEMTNSLLREALGMLPIQQ